MKTVSVKLPIPLASWLSHRSKELRRTQSDLVRQALEEQKRGDQRTQSCAALMAGLEGFFEGPSYLSTNPKHLKDFGK